MDIRIRQAKSADLPQLLDLWRLLIGFHQDLDATYALVDDAAERWTKYIETKFDDENWRVLVAECESAVAGYTAATVQEYPPVFKNPQHGFVQEIAVLEAFRGQGIGRRLVEEAVDWLKSRGVPEITVRIDEKNPASKALFAGAGFEPWVVVKRKVVS